MDPEFLFAADNPLNGRGMGTLAQRCARGELVRVRPGVYIASAAWAPLPRWERDRLRIKAAIEKSQGPRVLVQQSAAVIWGIPVVGATPDILLLASETSHGRRRGDLRWTARKLVEPLAHRDGMNLTSRTQTVLDMAAYLPFEHAVPAMDHVLRPDPVRMLAPLGKSELLDAAGRLPDQAKRRRARQVIDFADPRSESPAESYSRAVLHRQGFPSPELQQEFFSPGGQFLGRTDFYWHEQRLVGEFDGAVKYGRGASPPSSGTTSRPAPSWEILMLEKKREDAIRATGVRFVRWCWEDITRPPQHPESLVQRLVHAGLPRARRR